MDRIYDVFASWPVLARLVVAIVVAIIAAIIAHRIAFRVVEWTVRKRPQSVQSILIRHIKPPTRVLLPLLAVRFVVGVIAVGIEADDINLLLTLAILATTGWLAAGVVGALYEITRLRFRIDQADNLQARRIITQAEVLHRISVVAIAVITISMMLMTIPQVRAVGVSLFASAGIAGLAAGVAARPVLANIIAGLQVALTQPFHIDDVVIVDGQWGRIEEIGTAYVVVQIWDQRRLIVPLARFIESSFENWTRNTAALLGTVFLYTDYRVPIDELRAELKRLCEATPLWDGRVCLIQVTDAKERTLELRALVSAANAGNAWDLRCLVREGLVSYVGRHHPECLPRLRVEELEPNGHDAGTRQVGGSGSQESGAGAAAPLPQEKAGGAVNA